MRHAAPTATAPVRAEAVVTRNDPAEGPHFRLRAHVPGWPGSRPGQFVMITPGAITEVRRDDPLLPRPMAVFRESAGPAPEVEIVYKVEGRGTALLADVAVGDRVRVVGPLGRPFPLPAAGDSVVVVGGGTGVASLYGLVAAAPNGVRQTVVLGARCGDDLMAREDFERTGAEILFTTEDGSLGEAGLVTEPLARLLAEDAITSVYCCGPTSMMRACSELAAKHQVPCLVSLENTMACGYGVCLGCAVPRLAGDYALVCRDGPVFDSREIAWEGLL
ncbi:MAG: dihydroorotate dehydrogenase electron transfer subunit [Myxococcota bacterium]|nr:dihydroorotate dehydrogenase electron transfer subunit [Myxococcota bacterium]